MKRYRIFLCLILAALLLLPAASFADGDGAANLTRKCTFDPGEYTSAPARVFSKGTERYQIFDPGASFSFSWDDSIPAASLCIQWRELPTGVTVEQRNADGDLLSRETLETLPETVTLLRSDCRKAVVKAGEAGMQVAFCAVFGEGTLPDPFHEWIDTPQKLDYLLISTHPDDDVLFLGSVVPVYGAEQGYVGSIAYVTCRNRKRMTEAENGAWEMGLRYRPLFLDFPDVARDAPQEEKDTFVYEEVLLATVRLYRRYKPATVFAQDKNGEYGHWQHKLTSKAAVEAWPLAADPSYDPASYEQYGAWTVPKVFIHLHEENQILIDARTPLTFFDGTDAYNVARKAFLKHESQQGFGFAVTRDKGEYAFNRFGMAVGSVEVGEDVFDNIDETLLSSYVPPTPEPTEEPTPEPTAAPTEAPTATPAATPKLTAEPTPEPTLEPTPAKQGTRPQSYALWIVLGGLIAAGAVCAIVLIRRAKRKKA